MGAFSSAGRAPLAGTLVEETRPGKGDDQPSEIVTGFGCRPMLKLTTRTEGRCPKAAREGKRGKWGTRLSGRDGDLGGRCGAASTG